MLRFRVDFEMFLPVITASSVINSSAHSGALKSSDSPNSLSLGFQASSFSKMASMLFTASAEKVNRHFCYAFTK